REVEVGEDISSEGPFQLLRSDLLDIRLRVLLGRVVDEHVQPAESLDRLAYDVAAESGVADVPGQKETLAALFLDLPSGFLGVFVLVEIRDCDVSAFLGKGDRDGSANPTIPPGD